jgi:hypothetical protein
MKLLSATPMDIIVTHLPGVRQSIKDHRDVVYERAKGNLEEARASTTHSKIIGPGHLTRVTKTDGEVDMFVNLEAPNALAIEFGHAPSGVFDPASYGSITKAPHGLYILTRAIGQEGKAMASSGFVSDDGVFSRRSDRDE